LHVLFYQVLDNKARKSLENVLSFWPAFDFNMEKLHFRAKNEFVYFITLLTLEKMCSKKPLKIEDAKYQ
jgi:hypothetical protein